MRCRGDRACPYPVVKDDLCSYHYRDKVEPNSMMGSTLSPSSLLIASAPYDWGRAEYGTKKEKS